MSHMMKLMAAACAVLVLAACASTSFISTWKDPTVAPIGKAKGRTVVAVVMAEDQYMRHEAEDQLVASLNRRGAKGVASYTLLPPGVRDEALAKAAFEKAGADGVVVIRPIAKDTQTVATPVYYGGPYYGGYWGGYWGYGWGYPYGGVAVSTDTIVTVEVLVYSLKQNKLIWAGTSKTTNPSNVKSFISDLVVSAVWAMEKDKVF